MFDLRPYQMKSVRDIRGEFRTGARAVVLVEPTGAGKTVTFCHIANAAASLGTRTGILVHRDTLLKQASRALTECGVPHGIIAPGHTATDDHVHVASVQTLVRRLDRHTFDFLIIDECHHAPAGSWRKIIGSMPGARLLGVTATPCRADGRGLDDIFDRMVLGPSTAELIDDGFLVPPVVYAPAKRINLFRLHTRAGDYDQQELAETMDKPTITGDAVKHYMRICPGSPFVAFCVSIQHAEDVADDFNRSGVRTAAISGLMDADEVQEAVDGLKTGRLQGITSCDLISEGFDAPCIGAAILLRPTLSEGLYIQQVGRALRPAPGKSRAVILDHSGNCLKHGMPDDPREWSLSGERRRPSAGNGAAVPVKQCPKCYACHRPAPKCPACGHVYQTEGREVNQVAGELAQVPGDLLREVRETKIRGARTLGEFHQLAREFGYKSGWAWRQFHLAQTRTVSVVEI